MGGGLSGLEASRWEAVHTFSQAVHTFSTVFLSFDDETYREGSVSSKWSLFLFKGVQSHQSGVYSFSRGLVSSKGFSRSVSSKGSLFLFKGISLIKGKFIPFQGG